MDNTDCIRKFEPNFYGSRFMTLLKYTLNHAVGRNLFPGEWTYKSIAK